jgi:hypothetical protein
MQNHGLPASAAQTVACPELAVLSDGQLLCLLWQRIPGFCLKFRTLHYKKIKIIEEKD